MTTPNLWAPYEDKYKIHPESRAFTQLLVAMNARPLSELGVEVARQQSTERSVLATGKVDFDGEESEIIIPSPFAAEGIPVTVFKPNSRPEVPAIWIYFHGGGFVICNRKTHEAALKIIAQDSGAIVLNVEYRLLPNPEAPYAPWDDADVVTKWVLDNKEAVGGKSSSKVGVGGDSAGGHISISVTHQIPGLDFQVVVYPLVDTSKSNPTIQEFKQVPGLNSDSLKFFFDNSLSQLPDLVTNPRLNATLRTNLGDSPPTLIILAELDPLRGEGAEYAEKLRQAGVKVQLEVIEGVPHAFFTLRLVFQSTSALAYEQIVKFLKQFQ